MIVLKSGDEKMFDKHKGLKISLAILLAWTVLLPIWRQEIFKAPLSVPISISPPGSIQTKFHIPVDEYYDLIFVFDRNGISNEELHRIIGSGHDIQGKRGVPIAVRWEIHPLPVVRWEIPSIPEQQLVLQGNGESLNFYEWKVDKVTRRISAFILQPGDYEITATILKDVPEFHFIPAQIGLEIHGNKGAYRSPEAREIFLFGYLEPVVWLSDILLIIILAYKTWRDHASAMVKS